MFGRHKVTMIMALGPNNELGQNGSLIWSCPDDIKHFKKTTEGHIKIYGYNTYINLPKSARTEDDRINGHVLYTPSSTRQLFICGGAATYRDYEDCADEIIVTRIQPKHLFKGAQADRYYTIPAAFKVVASTKLPCNCIVETLEKAY